jgi:hypothetical protein
VAARLASTLFPDVAPGDAAARRGERPEPTHGLKPVGYAGDDDVFA